MSEFPSSLRAEGWTVVGARGWIGSHLCAYLRRGGATVAEFTHVDSARDAAGHLVWCSGVVYGAERSVRDTYRAHVTDVERWLDAPKLKSFTYLSSTRVYDLVDRTSEDTPLLLRSDAIYALTKGAGEALVLSAAHGRVVRLSNVYGTRLESPLFLNDVLRQAARERHVQLQQSLESAKDYVGLRESIEVIPRIATLGRERIYNVAAGRNTTTREIVDAIRAIEPRVVIDLAEPAPRSVLPQISIERVRAEFGFESRPLVEALPELYAEALAYFSAAASRAGSATPGHGGAAASG